MDNYSTPALTVEQLEIGYMQNKNPFAVLDKTHFILNEGEILTLLGESGSGRPIRGKALTGALPPSAKIESGLTRIGDRDLVDLSNTYISWNLIRGARVGTVYQDAQLVLSPVKTICVHFQKTLKKRSFQSKNGLERACCDMFQLLNFDDPERIMNAYPFELSSGMYQRAYTAMVLILEPEVLAADEPTLVLDVVSRRKVLRLPRRIQEGRKLSILLTMHNIGVAHEISDRVIVLRDGEIVERGAVRDILRNPREDYTGQLTDAQELAVFPGLQSHKQKEVLLQIKGLEKTLQNGTKQKNVLNWADLGLHRGETMGILEFSGCGKSTLAGCITGIERPDHGKILYRGQDVSNLCGKRRKHIRETLQIILQDARASLNPHRSALEIVQGPLECPKIGTPKE